MAGQTVIVSVLADTKRFDSAMRGTDTALRRFETSLRRVNRIGSIAFATITYAVGRFVIASVQAAEEAEAVDRKLVNQARNIKALSKSYKEVAQRLITVAEEQQRLLGVDDDLIKSTQTILLTFEPLAKLAGEVGGAFDRTTEAAFNLAELGFGSAESNAKALGKALSNPVAGLGALTRLGVIFTEQQKEQIANYIDAGNEAKAYGIILDAIEEQSAGAGIAGVTATQKLQTAWDNFQEVFGKKILPKLTPAIENFTEALYELAKSDEFTKFAESLADAFGELVKQGTLKKVVTLISDFLDFLKTNNINLIEFVGLLFATNGILGFLSSNIGDFYAAFTSSKAAVASQKVNDIATALALSQDNARLAGDAYDNAATKFDELFDLLDPADAPEYFEMERQKVGKLKIEAVEATEKFKGLSSEMAALSGTAVVGADKVKGKFAGMLTSISAFFKGFGKGFLVLGKGLLKFAGVVGLIIAVFEILQGVWKGFTDAFDAYFQENPGKVREFKQLWEDLGPVLEFLGGVLEGIGYIVGVVLAGAVIGVYEIFKALTNTIIDAYNAVADALGWAKLQKIGGNPEAPDNLVNGGYGSINQIDNARTPSAAPAGLVVNVNALAPSPEIGRSVVAAIQDYERTSGRRYA